MDKTIKYALNVLQTQYKHTVAADRFSEQHAFYKGLYTMLEIITTQGHSEPQEEEIAKAMNKLFIF